MRVVVVNGSITTEFIVFPVPLVRNVALRVVESSVAVHAVVLPLPVVDASSLVVNFAISVAEVVFDETFILGSVLVVFSHKSGFFHPGVFFGDFPDFLFRQR